MKRKGILVLALASCALVLFFVVGMGISVTELEDIVGDEIINRLAPNISIAAGMKLGSVYADSKTQEELEALVTSGATAGIRTAAKMALSIVYAQKTVIELTALATGDIDPAFREAASAPLQNFLIEMPADDLKTMAVSGATHELRLTAADLYYLVTRGDLTAEKLENEAVQNDSDELAYVAGVYLAGFYLSFNPKTKEELEELARNGESEGMRVAGATALINMLIQSDLTAGDLELAIQALGDGYPELLQAYTDVLAHRYGS
ncbi:hypothetical protein KAV67_00270 [Candidatus Bipolaricaulota bacterium]|nr:hypothetical protein [Candidatus Bipolaricaulota bacterium]